MKKQTGFTLIELMIAVVIVGILASVAYPAYQEQIRSARRADCSGALMGLAGAMERYFTANNSYAGATLGNGANDIYPAQCPNDGTAVYNLAIAAANGSSFTIQATPTNHHAGDKCGTFTLDNTGRKDITGADAGLNPQDCW